MTEQNGMDSPPLTWLKNTILQQLPGASITVFGSRINGTSHSSSDLDVAIDAGHRIDLLIMALLRDTFEDCDLPYRIDFSDWHRFSPAFQEIVRNTGMRI